jgi:hypothetical protein
MEDLLAVAIALVVFAGMYVLVDGLDGEIVILRAVRTSDRRRARRHRRAFEAGLNPALAGDNG